MIPTCLALLKKKKKKTGGIPFLWEGVNAVLQVHVSQRGGLFGLVFVSNLILKICLKYIWGKKNLVIAVSYIKIMTGTKKKAYFYNQFSELDVKLLTRSKAFQKFRG